MRRLAGLLMAGLVVALSTQPASAYLKLGTRVAGRTLNLKWGTQPVTYYITNQGAAGVSAQDFQTVVTRSFTTWSSVSTAQISTRSGGFTSALPAQDDSLSVIGFQNRPDLNRVLGQTSFIIDTTNGNIVESDIFINSSFNWSVAPAGETGRFDLESVVLHEVGHFLGMGHSALGETEVVTGGRRVIAAEAVMFPIAFSAGNIASRTLKADDIAGITDVYASAASNSDLGSLSGKVTKGGAGVQGAHVVAFNRQTGKLVGGFTLSDTGSFTIAGLSPGVYVVRVEPLDDAEVESFFTSSFVVDQNFKVKFHEKLIAVPRGGGSKSFEVKVVAK